MNETKKKKKNCVKEESLPESFPELPPKSSLES